MSRKNIVLRWERASLVFEDGDYKKALEFYSTMMKVCRFARLVDTKNVNEIANSLYDILPSEPSKHAIFLSRKIFSVTSNSYVI